MYVLSFMHEQQDKVRARTRRVFSASSLQLHLGRIIMLSFHACQHRLSVSTPLGHTTPHRALVDICSVMSGPFVYEILHMHLSRYV